MRAALRVIAWIAVILALVALTLFEGYQLTVVLDHQVQLKKTMEQNRINAAAIESNASMMREGNLKDAQEIEILGRVDRKLDTVLEKIK